MAKKKSYEQAYRDAMQGTPEIRQNALVKFKPRREKDWHYYPFTKKDTFVYLGDIAQMPGHCVVVRNSDGKVFTCYHTSDFHELTDEEA